MDFERLSVWMVFEENGEQDALEFMISDITDSKVVLDLNRDKRPPETAAETRRGFRDELPVVSQYAESAVLTFDLRSRTYSLDASARVRIAETSRSSVQFKKFIGTVPIQAIGIAAKSRRARMTNAGIQPSEFDPRSSEWLNEFVSALEPLADGVLEEYGRRLASGRNPRAQESGMAAAAALLRLSTRKLK